MKRFLLFMHVLCIVLCSSKPVRVACIGDSITYGHDIDDREHHSFPAVLGQLLGPDYEVRNYGVCGATLLRKGDMPYTEEQAYAEAKDFLPDIAVLMLGSNDTKPQNSVHAADFPDDLSAIISELQALPSHPRIYLCAPPKIYDNRFGIVDDVLSGRYLEIIKEFAAWRWLEYVDLYDLLASDVSKFYSDGVHPSAEGAELIAKKIHEAFCLRGDTGKPGKRVLFIGDSITDGAWGRADSAPVPQRDHYDQNHVLGHGYQLCCAQYWMSRRPEKGYRFYNRGIGGDKLFGALFDRWDEDVFSVRPDVVSLLVGINDTGDYTADTFPFEEWESRYKTLLEKTLASDPEISIVLCTPFCGNVGAQKIMGLYDIRKPVVDRLAAIVRSLVSEYGLTCVDFNAMFERLASEGKARDERYWIWDGIHPTAQAHERMAQMWNKAVRKAGILK